MNSSDIQESIKQIVIDILDVEDLNSFKFHEFSKIDDYSEWDSLAHINIITQLESVYKIRFSLDEIENFTEIRDLVKSISSKI